MEDFVESLSIMGILKDCLLALLIIWNCVVFAAVYFKLRFSPKGLYIPSTFQTRVFRSHRVDQRAIRPGDHIYTWTPFFIYSHHGICVETNTIIHFTGVEDGICASSARWFSRIRPSNPIHIAKCDAKCDFPGCGKRHGSGVVRSCISCFKEGRSLYRYEYGLGTYEYMLKLRDGTCTLASSDPTHEVIDRANQLLKMGFGTYDVIFNNCEDFSLYCKTSYTLNGGALCSEQINNRVRLVRMFLLSLALSRYICSPVLVCVIASLYHSTCRYLADIIIQNDVVKTQVKDLSVQRKKSQ
ncbi:NC domain-containing family protein [Tanacetum coccineum]